MWIVCMLLSVVLTVLNWMYAARGSRNYVWAAVGAFCFTVLTMLMEYRQILGWVNHGDWVALQDVVPSMFPILTVFAILMLCANALTLVLIAREASQ